jgi:hypothetical protein
MKCHCSYPGKVGPPLSFVGVYLAFSFFFVANCPLEVIHIMKLDMYMRVKGLTSLARKFEDVK